MYSYITSMIFPGKGKGNNSTTHAEKGGLEDEASTNAALLVAFINS